MLNPIHRQPRVIVFATVIIVAGITARGADPAAEAERELIAARAAEALLHEKSRSPKEHQAMEKIYRDLAGKYPRDVRALNACGSFLWNSGKLEEAEEFFRKAQSIEPENPETLSSLGAAALSGGEVRKAADFYSRACAAAPGSASLHFNLANVLFLFRHELLDASLRDEHSVVTKAMKHYSEACRLAPENTEYARGHAETFYTLPQPDWNAALEAWKHLHRISTQKDFALANMATIHLKLGQKPQARECVSQMKNPEFAARKARLTERIEKE